MKDLFKENGFLSEYGKEMVAPIQNRLENLLTSIEVRYLSETELRALGGVISKLVGDTIADFIAHKAEVDRKLSSMTDDEFENYMKNKYGERWMFKSASSEELKRCKLLAEAKIGPILKEMRKELAAP
jgi:hypothetical protein